MDVKSSFLNKILHKEVYLEQPKGFEDPKHSRHIFYLKMTLYGLNQAPHDWYERITSYLLAHGFKRGGVNKMLFMRIEWYYLGFSSLCGRHSI